MSRLRLATMAIATIAATFAPKLALANSIVITYQATANAVGGKPVTADATAALIAACTPSNVHVHPRAGIRMGPVTDVTATADGCTFDIAYSEGVTPPAPSALQTQVGHIFANSLVVQTIREQQVAGSESQWVLLARYLPNAPVYSDCSKYAFLANGKVVSAAVFHLVDNYCEADFTYPELSPKLSQLAVAYAGSSFGVPWSRVVLPNDPAASDPDWSSKITTSANSWAASQPSP